MYRIPINRFLQTASECELHNQELDLEATQELVLAVVLVLFATAVVVALIYLKASPGVIQNNYIQDLLCLSIAKYVLN